MCRIRGGFRIGLAYGLCIRGEQIVQGSQVRDLLPVFFCFPFCSSSPILLKPDNIISLRIEPFIRKFPEDLGYGDGGLRERRRAF